MRRVVIPERLDSDDGSPAEIQASLRDLRRINRWFGGASTTTSLLRRVAERTGSNELSVVDVGAGTGDAILPARRALGFRLCLLDRAATHLPRNSAPKVVGDALDLPFAAASFDVVTCALFLHHLEPGRIVAFVNEALRVARVAVVINDLQRSAAHLALVYAGLPLFRSSLTRHDAVASVRRAYTPAELRAMLARTRAGAVDVSHHYLYRIGVIAWKAAHA